MSRQQNLKEPEHLPMILRHFYQVKLDKDGYAPFVAGTGGEGIPQDKQRWFGPGDPVYEFDLYFANSYRKYSTEYVRARDNRQAKRKIRREYPHIIKFQWDDGYAD